MLKRIREFISASLNELVEESEDPERKVNQIIRDMERSIADLRKHIALALATQKMLEKRAARTREERRGLIENAESALREGKETLARRALSKKNKLAELAETLQSDLRQQREQVRFFKVELSLLEEKVQEARLKRETLMAKRRLARSQRQVLRSLNSPKSNKGSETPLSEAIIGELDAFDRLATEIEDAEAEVEAAREIMEHTRQYREQGRGTLTRDREVDKELNTLKQKLSRSAKKE